MLEEETRNLILVRTGAVMGEMNAGFSLNREANIISFFLKKVIYLTPSCNEGMTEKYNI